MIPLEEAQQRLLAMGDALPVEGVPLESAAGRYLAKDLTALRTQPARDLSAMDGYAVAHADFPGPWMVVGESAAGGEFSGMPGRHEAVRIFTGAPLPEGTDTVIIQEDATRDGERMAFSGAEPPARGQHVREAGSDFRNGEQLIAAGTEVSPAHIGLAALAGHSALPVRRQPRIMLLSTGDELVALGEPVGPNQLPSANGAMLAAMLAPLTCEVSSNIILPDEQTAIEEALAAADADIIVTIGGASVGKHDLVRPALKALGAAIDFWKVAMRPGKPVMAGKLNDKIILGLPGNPVSAYVSAFLFLLPLVRKMAGAGEPLPALHAAKTAAAVPANGSRAYFVRAQLAGDVITPLPSADSAILTSLSQADALIFRPAHAAKAKAGSDVEYLRL